MHEEQILEALNSHWRASAAGELDAEQTFTKTMPFVIILSQASESSGEAPCRHCGVIIPASRPASTSDEFSEWAICGSRNTQSTTRGARRTQ